MKKINKFLCLGLMAVALPCTTMLAGCATNPVVVQKIEYTESIGLEDVYTITYTDGTTSTFKVKNGSDGAEGQKGKDGKDATVLDAFEEYKKAHPTATYEEFLYQYLSFDNSETTKVINRCLLSSVKVYTEFKVTKVTNAWTQATEDTVSRGGGSAVIYKIDNDYTYIITNYHVVYNKDANEDNGGKIANRIVGYLYGSEGANGLKTDNEGHTVLEDGYPVYEYGDLGIEMEFVAGSAEKDIAIVRTPTSAITAINPQISAIKFADSYAVGESAIAIGNPDGMGLSVTQGVVSVDSEQIALNIDTTRYYRSVRIDTAIYNGSSGGGLFNSKGELIGITNAGDGTDQNVNYAVPLSIVKNTVENLMYYYNDNDAETVGAYKIYLGVTVDLSQSRYVYNEGDGTGNIVETIVVDEIEENSISHQMNLNPDDQILALYIGEDEYTLNRSFEMGDLLLNVRVGDEIKFKLKREGNTIYSTSYTITADDLVALA